MRWNFIIALSLSSLSVVISIAYPVESIQGLLWFTAFLIFVVGDSVTTSLIQKYDNLTEGGLATKYICGRNPSTRCTFGTRILFFSISLVVYLIGRELEFGERMIVSPVLLLPVIFTVVYFFLVLRNCYYIIIQELDKEPVF